MLIAQLSDPHVTTPGVAAHGLLDTHAALERAVDHVRALEPRPDAVLLTGDLVCTEAADEYAALRTLLDGLPMPVYPLPGNHDDRGLMRAAFADHPHLPQAGPFLHYTVESHPLRLVALDTHVPGEPWGELCAARLEWLAARLAEAPQRPTLLAMHHPPFATGTNLDRSRCRNSEALAAVLAPHRQVVRIVCGHVHRAMLGHWHGVPVSTCPSTGYQLELSYAVAQRVRIALEPPALQLHRWSEESGLVTALSPIGPHAVHAFHSQTDGPPP